MATILYVTMSILALRAGATVEWISRPRSRLFVTAGETVKIDWKFQPGAIAVVYDKKARSLGRGTRIAHKQSGSPAEVLKSYRDKIIVEKSGALKIVDAGLADEGFYSIEITYTSNSLRDEVEIKIQEVPVIIKFPSHPKKDIYYTGMTLSLVCMAKGRPDPKVSWYKDNMDNLLERSEGSIVHKIDSATQKDSGKYTCLASNQAGQANRTIAFIIYRRPYDMEFFHNTALDGTIFEGQSVTFTCTAKGSPPISHYKLLHNGRFLAQTQNGVYKIREVRLDHNGNYSCVPINKAGLGQNRTLVLNVKERPSYWEEKLRKTTISPPTEDEITSMNPTTMEQLTETISTAGKNYVARGAGHVLHASTFSLSLTFVLMVARLST